MRFQHIAIAAAIESKTAAISIVLELLHIPAGQIYEYGFV